jgi:hypothetical protein
MTFKKILSTGIALLLMATLAVAMGGCDDLGVYEDTDAYYSSFGDIVLIDSSTREQDSYSVEKYFYNEESREAFLEGEDGVYGGVEHAPYVYMAIPFESDIDMDTLAMYLQSETDATVYISVFAVDRIPTQWKSIEDNYPDSDEGGESSDEESGDGTEKTEKVYDDPDPQTKIGEITVHLKGGNWGSFVLDEFKVRDLVQKSIEINKGQYILLQIRNNSGVRVFDEEKQAYVDREIGLDLPKLEITMTNLLIRALSINTVSEEQGGE